MYRSREELAADREADALRSAIEETPALGEALARQELWDRWIAGRLEEVALPEGLAGRLVARVRQAEQGSAGGAEKGRAPRWQRRLVRVAALCAAVAVLAAGAWYGIFRETGSPWTDREWQAASVRVPPSLPSRPVVTPPQLTVWSFARPAAVGHPSRPVVSPLPMMDVVSDPEVSLYVPGRSLAHPHPGLSLLVPHYVVPATPARRWLGSGRLRMARRIRPLGRADRSTRVARKPQHSAGGSDSRGTPESARPIVASRPRTE